MASIGKRGRGRGKGTAPGYSKNSSTVGKKRSGQAPGTTGSTGSAASGSGPSWKPAKSSVTGNYGQAVSTAAKAKPKFMSKVSSISSGALTSPGTPVGGPIDVTKKAKPSVRTPKATALRSAKTASYRPR